jgi:prevent-host-death family protein
VAKTVSKSEFKPRVLSYLREVEASGEPLVVTDRGRPVVRIEPYRPVDEVLEILRGCVVRYEAPTEPVALDAWEALGES